MPTTLELLQQSGISTGKVSQIPKSLDQRPDLSRISELTNTNRTTRSSNPQVSSPSPMSGDAIKALKYGGSPTPTTGALTPVSNSASSSASSTPASPTNSPLSSPLAKASIPAVVGALLEIPVAAAGTALGNALAPLLKRELERDGQLPDPRYKKALDDANKRYDKALKDRQSANPANSKGSGSSGGSSENTQLTGTTGVSYYVTVKATFSGGQVQYSKGYNPAYTEAELQAQAKVVVAPIGGVSFGFIDPFQTVGYYINGELQSSFQALDGRNSVVTSIEVFRIARTDGQPEPIYGTSYAPPLDSPKVSSNPTGDDPYFPTITFNPDGSTSVYPKFQPDIKSQPNYDNRPFKEPVKPSFAPTPSPVAPTPTGDKGTNPLTTSPKDASPASNPNSGAKPAFASPAFESPSFVSKPYVSGVSNPADYGKEIDNATGKPRVPVTTTPTDPTLKPSQNQNPLTNPLTPPVVAKPQTTPNTPTQGNTQDSQNILEKIGLALAGLTALKIGSDFLVNKSTKIDNQTTPQAQQTNAKQGVCDAMQPDQCGFEGVKQATTEATNPIKDQTVANAGLLGNILAAIANLASTIATFFGNVLGKLDGIRTFLEKVSEAAKLDKIYNFLTFLTVIHNAQMLSNNLLQTLESTISQGLAVFGIKDGDNPIDINAIINKSTTDLLKSILGETRYNEFDTAWKSANKIYQSGANLLYQVRSLYDSGKATAELTGANVGQLMNALKKDGVVTESAYPNKSESPSQVNSLMDRLQNLESAASHLNSISSNAYGITETVKQIKDDKAAFDKLVEDSPLKKGIENKAATADAAAKKLASPSPPLSTTDLVKPD
ncbi:hypothetical protein HCU40_16760 [Pseudanabaena biceps]|nr:hypothetical protein [Pseudanabaena biceps]